VILTKTLRGRLEYGEMEVARLTPEPPAPEARKPGA
jgi:hypothetical protein